MYTKGSIFKLRRYIYGIEFWMNVYICWTIWLLKPKPYLQQNVLLVQLSSSYGKPLPKVISKGSSVYLFSCRIRVQWLSLLEIAHAWNSYDIWLKKNDNISYLKTITIRIFSKILYKLPWNPSILKGRYVTTLSKIRALSTHKHV